MPTSPVALTLSSSSDVEEAAYPAHPPTTVLALLGGAEEGEGARQRPRSLEVSTPAAVFDPRENPFGHASSVID